MVIYSKNPEYPDLPFAWPAAYGESRYGRGWDDPLPRLIVVHYTAGSEGLTSAENGAGYDQIRTDGTSAHFYHDPDSTVQCVPTQMRANTAFRNGNTLGIHHELCGTLQTREQWLDTNSRAIIRRAAAQMVRDMRKWKIPLRKLGPEQVRAGESGFAGHYDITYAFPEDGGTHEDPGKAFPWDVLFDDISNQLQGVDVATTFDTPYVGADGQARTHAQLLQNLHDDWFFARYQTPSWPKSVQNRLAQLLARPLLELSDEDLTSLAEQIAAAVVVEDNPLTEADSPVIEASVLKALKSLVAGTG